MIESKFIEILGISACYFSRASLCCYPCESEQSIYDKSYTHHLKLSITADLNNNEAAFDIYVQEI